METIRFETGKTYYGFWAADSSTEYEFTIAARTPGFVTLQHGTVAEQKRVRVRIVEGVEQCSPFGAYSMSPVLRADRVRQAYRRHGMLNAPVLGRVTAELSAINEVAK